MNESVKQAQENAYKLWGEHVSTGYLLYPNEYCKELFKIKLI